MNAPNKIVDEHGVEALYEEARQWHVNTGGKTIHAKRMPGRYRTLKRITGAVWLLFFLGPYLRWDGRQAVLFDIPNRQFHLFNVTVLPQDVWLLALLLLFLAIELAVVTSLAGRVFCGYFCFQTVWTDVFTWIEERLEGSPTKRHKLDRAPWDAVKVRIKLTKHTLWLMISVLTGVSFAAWFTDAFKLWHDYLTLQAPAIAWIVLLTFVAGTYLFAGFMREQVCFWLCPYARIQGVMYDRETVLPTYDFNRGEPRGKARRDGTGKSAKQGDCIDCHLCVAVCPTGIDIREGQQEGCITCALCLDACDSVMDKVGKPHGLIRYASLNEIEGVAAKPLFKRPRVLTYFFILVLALAGIIYGFMNISTIDLKILHERQPLYVLLSDGSIQNKYVIKILNKTDNDLEMSVTASGPDGLQLIGAEQALLVASHKVLAHTIYLRLPAADIKRESIPVSIKVTDTRQSAISTRYQTMFIGPSSNE